MVFPRQAIPSSLRKSIQGRQARQERWSNMAAFSTASSLFRFRKIPELEITADMFITCADGRYRILSAEDVRGRGMYIEVLAERLEPSVR